MKDRIALVTGASPGIGAVYADRWPAAATTSCWSRDSADKLDSVAARLRDETGVAVEVLARRPRRSGRLAARSSSGCATTSGSACWSTTPARRCRAASPNADLDTLEKLVALNVTALTRLAARGRAAPGEGGRGRDRQHRSVLALAPGSSMAIYAATKAYVLTCRSRCSWSSAPRGVYVQAVLPARHAHRDLDAAGRDVNSIPGVMEVDELVDAALVGFDRRER